MKQFEYYFRANNIKLGILTVGEGSAQAVCDQMVRCEITAIWNFAPCELTVHSEILIQNENPVHFLAHLNNLLCNSNQED